MYGSARRLGRVFLLVLSLVPVAGFGTIEGLGQHEEHAQITRQALRDFGFSPDTMNVLAGGRGKLGAVGAPDRPGRGLILMAHAHCDNGDWLPTSGYPRPRDAAASALAQCRSWVFSRLDQAVQAAGGLVDGRGQVIVAETPRVADCRFDGRDRRGKCVVLAKLGEAFHASQDFYAHSNWVDRPTSGPIGPDNPPGLGQNGPAPWLDPELRAPLPPSLITGCYGLPEVLHCRGGRVRHSDLNKDRGLVQWSGTITGHTARGSKNDNFQRAVAAALADTAAKWTYVERQIYATYGERRGKLILLTVKQDLAESN